jgi:hypothetical protein
MHNAAFSSRSREVTPALWMPPWGECPRRLGGWIFLSLFGNSATDIWEIRSMATSSDSGSGNNGGGGDRVVR